MIERAGEASKEDDVGAREGISLTRRRGLEFEGGAAWSCASRVASACSDRGPGAPETLQV